MTIDNKMAFLCPICGSDNLLFDAYASWGMESQQWELVQAFPDQESTAYADLSSALCIARFCHDTCDGSYFIEPIKVDLITLSKIKNADEATKEELLEALRRDADNNKIN